MVLVYQRDLGWRWWGHTTACLLTREWVRPGRCIRHICTSLASLICLFERDNGNLSIVEPKSQATVNGLQKIKNEDGPNLIKVYAIADEFTHLCLAFHKRDIGIQCRPRSDAAERGVWSGSTLFALSTWISINMVIIKTYQTPHIL